jgi:uncharacterized lipoprotein YajG
MRSLLLACLLVLWAGCATPTKTKVVASGLPRAGAKVTVGSVTNETGKKFEFDVEAALRDALAKCLAQRQLRADSSAAPGDLLLRTRITDYRPGSAFKRWVAPGWGATVLAISAELFDHATQALVAQVEYQRSVAVGGFYTLGAERYIFDHLAADVAHDLQVRIAKGGDFVVSAKPRGDVVKAVEPTVGGKTVRLGEIRDKRPEPGRIGERTAAFGVSMGDVYLSRDVPGFIREALELEWTAAGHRLAATNADVNLTCELQKFWLHTKTTPLYWDVIAEMQIAIASEEHPAERRKEFTATASKRTYVWPSASLCGQVLDHCTDQLMSQVRTNTPGL